MEKIQKGNLYKIEKDGRFQWCKILQINDNKIKYEYIISGESEENDISYIKPIQINHDTLISLGFECIEKDKYYKFPNNDPRFSYKIEINSFNIISKGKEKTIWTMGRSWGARYVVDSISDIQNAFFDLTHEYLIISNPS